MSKNLMSVAAIHDISGVGRCSLAVVLPVLSVMGVQACPVPTAVLSTHTGGFGDVALRDLTDYMQPALSHYKRLGLNFDCVYSGFLSSVRQIDHCLDFFSQYPGALAVVDPVMGDHGKAYRTCTKEIRARMGELVAKADIITPNLTEVCMLLNEDYKYSPLTSTGAKSLLARLGEKGPKQVVITGVQLSDGAFANLAYDRERGAYWRVDCEYVPAAYPGTGDIFAAVVTGALLSNDSLPIALDTASSFLELTIKTTYSYGVDPRHGVMLEKSLKWLTERNLSAKYKPL